jgi:hypothetical protein
LEIGINGTVYVSGHLNGFEEAYGQALEFALSEEVLA